MNNVLIVVGMLLQLSLEAQKLSSLFNTALKENRDITQEELDGIKKEAISERMKLEAKLNKI